MKFGKLEDISGVDFKLPAPKISNKKLLEEFKINKFEGDVQKTDHAFELFFGCPAWGNREWIGKLYPKGTKPNQFLLEYARHFNTVELNSTHYGIPPNATLEKWKVLSGEGFRFCPKFHQAISHHQQLENCKDWVDTFYSSIQILDHKLGIPFLQMPPSFKLAKFKVLEHFVNNLPSMFPISIEVRSVDMLHLDLFELIQSNGHIALITDTAGHRELVHMNLTSDTAMVRFVGNNLHPTDFTRIDDWIDRISLWRDWGLKTLYFFIHEPDEFYCPELASYFVKRMNEKLNLDIPEIALIPQNQQGTLF